MKNLVILFLTCAAVLGQSRPVSYDNTTRNVAPPDLDYVGASGNFTTLQQNSVGVVTTARILTAGAGMAGGGDLSADRTVTWAPASQVLSFTFFNSSAATRTITFGLSGATDPVLSLGENVFNISTGVLQYGGNEVATAANNLSFFAATTSAQFFGVISDEVGSTGTAIRVAGTASSGFVPVANGAGVVTWTAQSGSGSAPAGTVVNSGTPAQFALPYYADTTGTNIAPSGLLTDATGTNFYAGNFSIYSLIVSNLTAGRMLKMDSGGVVTNAIEGADYASPVSTNDFINKTLDAAATGNTLKQTKTLILQRPDYGDGIGAVPQTNTYTASGLMHFTFSGNAETNANWVVYEFDCPADLDTTVAMTARFAFLSGGTDADDYVFHITYDQVAPGTAYPTGTGVDLLPIVMTVTPTTAANGDLQQSAATTLTGWVAALTPGRPMQVQVARLQNTQDDGARDVQLVISYGSTL